MRGPSGIGKTDLALQLLDRGAELVGDDQLELFAQSEKLMMKPLAPGLVELRNLGIFRLPHVASTAVDMLFDLTHENLEPRLPAPASEKILGVTIPVIRLDPRWPSAVARLRVILTAERAE